MKKGILFVLSGPSGCGKGTVLEKVLQDPNLFYSVSATTRPMRDGDIDGVTYQFMDVPQFEALIASDGILEYAQYCGNYYGTPRKSVEDHLNAGENVMLEIEVVGAEKIRKKCPQSVSIFLMPPSLEELQRRLIDRGTESREVVDKRIAQAQREIDCASTYDYIVVNDDLEKAIEDVRSILRAEACRASRISVMKEEKT